MKNYTFFVKIVLKNENLTKMFIPFWTLKQIQSDKYNHVQQLDLAWEDSRASHKPITRDLLYSALK